MNKNKDMIFLAICLKSNDEHIGNIKLGPINRFHKRAGVSLFIGEKKCWGKGYATEAITLIRDFAFKKLNLHKLAAGCFEENLGSQKAFLKAGFVKEGIQREHVYLDGEYCDALILGIINNKV